MRGGWLQLSAAYRSEADRHGRRYGNVGRSQIFPRPAEEKYKWNEKSVLLLSVLCGGSSFLRVAEMCEL